MRLDRVAIRAEKTPTRVLAVDLRIWLRGKEAVYDLFGHPVSLQFIFTALATRNITSSQQEYFRLIKQERALIRFKLHDCQNIE